MLRFNRLMILGAACLLFSACEEGWTDEAKRTFLSKCTAQARGMYASEAQTDAYCRCNLEVTMRHFPSQQAVNELRYKDAADSTRVRQELEACSLKAQR